MQRAHLYDYSEENEKSSDDENSTENEDEEKVNWIDEDNTFDIKNLKFFFNRKVPQLKNFPLNLGDDQLKNPLTYFLLLFDDSIW